ALSAGTPPETAAQFVEGFLTGSGAVLLHDDPLWQLLDDWVAALAGERFDTVLPLLRRTFSTFHAPERRQMGERARQGRRAPQRDRLALDVARAERVLPVLAQLLGVTDD